MSVPTLQLSPVFHLLHSHPLHLLARSPHSLQTSLELRMLI